MWKGWKWYMPLYGIGIPMWVQGVIALLMIIFTFGYFLLYVRKELAKPTTSYKVDRATWNRIANDEY